MPTVWHPKQTTYQNMYPIYKQVCWAQREGGGQHHIVVLREYTEPYLLDSTRTTNIHDDKNQAIFDGREHLNIPRNSHSKSRNASATNSGLVTAQDFHFFYTRSHLIALQNCALVFSTNFQFNSIF